MARLQRCGHEAPTARRRRQPARRRSAGTARATASASHHHRQFEVMGAHSDAAAAPGSRSGRPMRAASASSAPSTTGIASRCNALDDGSGRWSGFVEGARAGHFYKYRIQDAHGHWMDKADPYAFRMRAPARAPHRRSGTSRTPGATASGWRTRGERQSHREPDVHLRGAPGLLAARGGRPLPELPRHRACGWPRTARAWASRTWN